MRSIAMVRRVLGRDGGQAGRPGGAAHYAPDRHHDRTISTFDTIGTIGTSAVAAASRPASPLTVVAAVPFRTGRDGGRYPVKT
jgi:hypothetical protein